MLMAQEGYRLSKLMVTNKENAFTILQPVREDKIPPKSRAFSSVLLSTAGGDVTMQLSSPRGMQMTRLTSS